MALALPTLARFVAGIAAAAPASVRDHAALALADTVGVVLGDSREPCHPH